MTDNHMVFFAEIAFIYGGNDSSEEDVFGSEKSSEKIIKSSETTAISSGTGSGTHPHKVLGQAKLQRRAWEHPYYRNQASFFSSYIKSQKQSEIFNIKNYCFGRLMLKITLKITIF